MQDAFSHCAELVRAADRDRFLAALFAPLEHRSALHALLAFNIEVGRVREVAREPLPGEIRLQWWADVLRGERRGEAAANPVADALVRTLQRYRLPIDPLLNLVDAHRFDIYNEPMATVADLESYAAKTSSSLLAVAAQILGGHDAGADDGIMRPAGVADTVARLMTAFPRQAARRQLFVPVDLLDRHEVAVEDIFAGKPTPELRAALVELAEIGLLNLAATGQNIAAAPATIIPALLPLAVTRLQLKRMKRLDFDPFAPRDVSPWRRQWAIWRAAQNVRRIAG
jgi:phytoene synthase